MRELKADSLKRLGKTEFEGFCWRLLVEERRRYFAPQTVHLDPPSGADIADGGRDLLAIVRQRPRTLSDWGLIPDRTGEVWYSCKSSSDDGSDTKTPRGWAEQIRRDLDPSPRIIDAQVNPPIVKADADTTLETRKQQGPPHALLQALADGGSYFILVNVPAAKQREFRHEIQILFEFWIQRGLDQAVNLDGRIELFDAHKLAEIYRENPFTLDSDFLKKLDVSEPDFLLPMTRWTAAMDSDRLMIDFQADEQRNELLADLADFLKPEHDADRVFRLWGAPGIGKTRLIHRALELADFAIQSRVRFTTEARETLQWLAKFDLTGFDDLVLVADEVRAEEASLLAQEFTRASAERPNARLLIVGPVDHNHEGKPEPVLLGRLSDAEIDAIIANRGIEDGELTQRIAKLSEGYPLFAFWLSQALATDPGLLDEPSACLTGDSDPWQVTSAVLIGPRDVDLNVWRARATLHGKALLLTILAHDEDWATFTEEIEGAFAGALRVDSFNDLLDAARACEARGLLRRAGHRRYISPANLERMLLNHFFGSTEPPLDPSRIRERLPERFGRLLERARRVDADGHCRRNLARAALDALDSMPRKHPFGRSSLAEAAFTAPEEAAFAIQAFLVSGPAKVDRRVYAALRHVYHRNISIEAFRAVEDALWRTAALDQQALDFWASGFSMRAATHRPFPDRLALLRRRLSDSNAGNRLRALRGLAVAVQSSPSQPVLESGWDDIDAPWWKPETWEEHYQLRDAALEELLELTSDSDPRVSDMARAQCAALDWLDDTHSAEIMTALATRVSSWTGEQRSKLREMIWGPEDVDPEHEDGPRHLLAAALAPQNFEDRLIDHVGSWMPVFQREAPALLDKSEPNDQALNREIIADPRLLIIHIDWLGSRAAVRARSFAKALGQADIEGEILPVLLNESAASRAPGFVAGYLVGRDRGLDDSPLDDWLEQQLDRNDLSELLAATLMTTDGTDRRATILRALLERGTVVGSSLTRLGYSDWARDVSNRCLDELVLALVDRGPSSHVDAQFQALGLLATRLRRDHADFDPDIRDAMTRASGALLLSTARGQLPNLVERAWVKVAGELVSRGEKGAFTLAFVRACASDFSGFPHHLVAALRSLLREDRAALVWDVVAEVLNSGTSAASVRDILDAASAFDFIASTRMLEWVGDDLDRGSEIAEFTHPHDVSLDPLARALIAHFGSTSEPARVISNRAASSPTGPSRGSAVGHRLYAMQVEHARAWQADPDGQVRSWAAAVEVRLAALARQEQVERDIDRRYG